MKKSISILVSLIMLLVSCDSYNKILTTNNIDYKYEAAKAYYLEGEYVKASQLLESVVTLMKGSDKAEESLILLAKCYYDSEDYETASQYFKVYYTNFPRGEFAEYARFHSGKSLYMDITEPELDQSDTYLAISELQLFMEYFPLSSLRPQAQEMIMRMHDLLVEKEFLSAQLYYDLGNFMAYRGNNYLACIITAQNALKDYPYTRLREDLSMLILRARYHMAKESVADKMIDRYRDAIDEYHAFKNEFPESKYLKEADKIYRDSQKAIK